MMIFKRWFKPKWQHQDPAIRMSAIATLDHADQQQKEVLHELAFNDGAEQVRRAALERLNEFSLWWQASKHEPADRLKQFAENQLIDMLLQNRVSAGLKQKFIEECHRSSILEKLAQQDADPQVRYQLLLRLQRQDLWTQAVTDASLPLEIRQQLLPLIDDDKALERLARQAEPALVGLIRELLEQRTVARERPEKLKKQLVLLLAKLNAVRERSDALPAWQQWQELLAQWQPLAQELHLLPDGDEFAQKFQRIEQQTLTSLKPRVDAAQAAAAQAELAAAAQAKTQQFSEQIQQLSLAITDDIAVGDLDVAANRQQELETLTKAVLQAQLPSQQQLVKQLAKLQQQLDSVPLISEQLAQLARLLADISAQPLPSLETVEAAWQAFGKWQQQWQATSRSLSVAMPEQFAMSYQQTVERWRSHCEPLLQGQQKQLKLLRSKLQEFKRLHEEGRYKTLFGLLKGIEQQAASLSALPAMLQKDLDTAREQIQQLTDLQAYIATPRKQELVEQMQALVSEPIDSIRDRADAVKLARQTWNSLGRADEGVDEALNDQFNQLCEQAFAPCRDYYAEQDAQRVAAALRKRQLIQQMTSYAFADVKDVEKQLQLWQEQWEQAGATERDVHQELLEQYRSIVTVARQFVKQHYQSVAARKQQLIDQAKQLVELTDAFEAVNQLKTLQQQWKAAGYAGKKADQELWNEFRSICDAGFAKRDTVKAARKEQDAQQLVQQQELLVQLSDQTDDVATLQQLKSVSWLGELRAEAAAMMGAIEQRQSDKRIADKASQQQLLFDVLASAAPDVSLLPPAYRLVFGAGQEQTLSRHQLTVAMELIAGVESAPEDQGLRQAVQMTLLSEKLNQGEDMTVAALFGRWLQYGAIASEELPLLQRVQQVLARS